LYFWLVWSRTETRLNGRTIQQTPRVLSSHHKNPYNVGGPKPFHSAGFFFCFCLIKGFPIFFLLKPNKPVRVYLQKHNPNPQNCLVTPVYSVPPQQVEIFPTGAEFWTFKISKVPFWVLSVLGFTPLEQFVPFGL